MAPESGSVFFAGALFALAGYKLYVNRGGTIPEQRRQDHPEENWPDHPNEENRPLCSICFTDPGVVVCTGTDSHSLCVVCLNDYASQSFQETGTFCRHIHVHNQDQQPSESARGEIPCPLYERAGCSCFSLPIHELGQYLTQESYALLLRAVGRHAVLTAQQLERQNIENLEREQNDNTNILEHLLRAVREVMSLGRSVACPSCSYRGEKDDGCMHITCEICRAQWCYCCGRHRANDDPNSCACDRRGLYLQVHEGWGQFIVEPGETDGYGALHEFHRRRQVYFIRRLVEGVPDAPWHAFWERHSEEVLNGVPTPGRRILLEDIENAEPPVFSTTTEEALEWRDDADSEVAALQERLVQVDRANNGADHRVEENQQRPAVNLRQGLQALFQRRRRRRQNHRNEVAADEEEEGPERFQHQNDQNFHEPDFLDLAAQEILDNDALDPEMRQAMVESLRNGDAAPNEEERFQHQNDDQHFHDPDPLDIQAQEILDNNALLPEIRQAMVESLRNEAVPHEEEVPARFQHQYDQNFQDPDILDLAAQEILDDDTLDPEIRQARVESLLMQRNNDPES